MIKRILMAAVAAVSFSGAAGAATLDQFTDPAISNVGFNGYYDRDPNTPEYQGPPAKWQQKVIAGISGTLAAIEISANPIDSRFNPQGAESSLLVSVNLGSGWQSDANDFEAVVSIVDGWNRIDLLSSDISISSGDIFSIGIEGVAPLGASFRGSTGNGYAGNLYVDGSLLSNQDYDIDFRTYVLPTPLPPGCEPSDFRPPKCDDFNPNVVPLPAALPMLLAGIGGLGFMARRKRKSQQKAA
jgi:opacity protein-like surface antigen